MIHRLIAFLALLCLVQPGHGLRFLEHARRGKGEGLKKFFQLKKRTPGTTVTLADAIFMTQEAMMAGGDAAQPEIFRLTPNTKLRKKAFEKVFDYSATYGAHTISLKSGVTPEQFKAAISLSSLTEADAGEKAKLRADALKKLVASAGPYFTVGFTFPTSNENGYPRTQEDFVGQMTANNGIGLTTPEARNQAKARRTELLEDYATRATLTKSSDASLAGMYANLVKFLAYVAETQEGLKESGSTKKIMGSNNLARLFAPLLSKLEGQALDPYQGVSEAEADLATKTLATSEWSTTFSNVVTGFLDNAIDTEGKRWVAYKSSTGATKRLGLEH